MLCQNRHIPYYYPVKIFGGRHVPLHVIEQVELKGDAPRSTHKPPIVAA